MSALCFMLQAAAGEVNIVINPSIQKDVEKVADAVNVSDLAKPVTAYCRYVWNGLDQIMSSHHESIDICSPTTNIMSKVWPVHSVKYTTCTGPGSTPRMRTVQGPAIYCPNFPQVLEIQAVSSLWWSSRCTQQGYRRQCRSPGAEEIDSGRTLLQLKSMLFLDSLVLEGFHACWLLQCTHFHINVLIHDSLFHPWDTKRIHCAAWTSGFGP